MIFWVNLYFCFLVLFGSKIISKIHLCLDCYVPEYFFLELLSVSWELLKRFNNINSQLILVLFVGTENRLKLDWPTRVRICVGIAQGLAFLHEESVLKIVHRDIKATNVLLDQNLNPKISDFGLARLDEEEKTHISTRVAGTMLVILSLPL